MSWVGLCGSGWVRLGWMKVCWIDLGQVGLGWDGLGCNIALRWGTVFGSFQLLKAKICVIKLLKFEDFSY